MDTGKEVGDYCKEVNLNELNDNLFVRKIAESLPTLTGDNDLSSFAADFAVNNVDNKFNESIGRSDFIFYGQVSFEFPYFATTSELNLSF